MTEHPFLQILESRFAGRISHGPHPSDGEGCALEIAHAAMGDLWSDAPGERWPDLRPLNDGPWSSDRVRTAAMIPVMLAYWDWASWPHARRQRVVERVIVSTVREIIAELPELPDETRQVCRAVTDLVGAQAAEAAAWAAARAAWAAWAAAWAAWAAARAAAEAAAWAAADTVLARACRLWVEAAETS